MKKLVILFVLFLSFLMQTNAQSIKYCDLELKIASPSNLEAFPNGDTAKLYFSVINHGPDTILNSDTLHVAFTFDNGGTTIYNYLFPDVILPNDSANFGPYANILGSANSTANDTMTICAYFKDTPTYFIDSVSNNDTADCHSFILLKKDIPNSIAVLETKMENQIQIYPNPSNSTILIKVNDLNLSSLNLNIMDLMGRKMLSKVLLKEQFSQGQFELDISKLPVGLYFIELYLNGKKVTKRFIKN